MSFLVGEHQGDNGGEAQRRAAYRRERDLVAHAATWWLAEQLGAAEGLRAAAVRDELLRRESAPGSGGTASLSGRA